MGECRSEFVDKRLPHPLGAGCKPWKPGDFETPRPWRTAGDGSVLGNPREILIRSQRFSHVAPERRRPICDPPRELVVRAGDIVPKVEAGKIRAPASLPKVVSPIPKFSVYSSVTSPIPTPLAQLLQGASECLATREHGLEQVTVLFDALERLAHPEAARRHVIC